MSIRAKADVRRNLTGQRSFVAVVLLLTLCFLLTSGAILWELRRQIWDAAMRAAENLVMAVSQDIGRNIELCDLSLQAVMNGLELPDIRRLNPETRQALLFDRAATAKYLGSILVLDERGNVIEDAASVPPRSENFSDRSYFTAHQDDPKLGLYISEPFRRRLTGNGDWVIAFSRRLNRPDGSFGGVVSGTLRLDYFNGLFTRFKLGEQSAVTLLRTDGTLLVRAPYDDAFIGRRFVGTDIMRNLVGGPHGRFVARASLDGVTRAINFSHVADLPLVVLVAQSPDDILASWTRWAVGIVAVLTTMCLAVAALAKVSRNELRRRFKAEAETQRREEELRLITDHATDVIVRLDAALVRRYVSPSSQNVFGCRPEKLLGQDFRDTMHSDDRGPTTQVVEAARECQGRASAMYRIRRRDGELGWVESQFSYMPGDGGFTVLVRDITQRKGVERDLTEAHEELRRLAATDGLTGLANRRRFDEAVVREWRRAAREERALTLLLLDVDRFKQFNDRYGHQEGDACLRAVAQAVSGCARRPADLVARYGGEELVILLPDTDEFHATEVAERIRSAVQGLAVPHLGNPAHGAVLTVSIGCGTTIPGQRAGGQDEGTEIEAFITLCDQALYAAKNAGRNRVMTHPDQRRLLSNLPCQT